MARKAALLGAVLVAGPLAYSALIGAHRLVPREVAVSCHGLHESPVKILLISDVDFVGEGQREQRVRRIAEEFRADLVLVAGDFLDREAAILDPEMLSAAGGFLRSLPARFGRFLVPGEEEATHLSTIRRAWDGADLQVLANESRLLSIRGELLDLFGGDPTTDPAPWGLGEEGGWTFVDSRGRWVGQELIFLGPGSEDWQDVEITLAFQAIEDRTFLDIRFGWQPGPDTSQGAGWQLIRNGSGTPFRLRGRFPGKHSLSGKLTTSFVPPPGVWCRARIRLDDDGEATRVRARLWRADRDEPEHWMVDAADRGPDRRRQGTIGFGGREGHKRYADLKVFSGDDSVLLEESFRNPEMFRRRWWYPSTLARWLRHPADGRPRLLLTHNPDLVLDVLAVGEPPPCLLLAGHTHGGQIRLPWVGALFTDTELGREHVRGHHSYRGVPLYVTAGVGTSFVPLRLFNPPEVTLLTLTPP